jgi:hypothetical protein
MEQREATAGLYDDDFALWIKAQVTALREGRLSAVDVANVTEELEALAKRDRREIQNRLRVLAAHLLKRRYQPEMATASWDATIIEQGARIRGVIDDSPSLRREMGRFMCRAYPGARELASAETRKPLSEFPAWPDEDLLSAWCDAVTHLDMMSLLAEARNEFKQHRHNLEGPERDNPL